MPESEFVPKPQIAYDVEVKFEPEFDLVHEPSFKLNPKLESEIVLKLEAPTL